MSPTPTQSSIYLRVQASNYHRPQARQSEMELVELEELAELEELEELVELEELEDLAELEF